MVTDAVAKPLASPFLVVTPLGLAHRDWLAASLAQHGIQVVARHTIRRWSIAASALYLRSWDAQAVARAQRFQVRWRQLFTGDIAERWALLSDDDHAKLCAVKAQLRCRLRSVPLWPRRTGEPTFSLHAFHVPDLGDVPRETACLAPFVASHLGNA